MQNIFNKAMLLNRQFGLLDGNWFCCFVGFVMHVNLFGKRYFASLVLHKWLVRSWEPIIPFGMQFFWLPFWLLEPYFYTLSADPRFWKIWSLQWRLSCCFRVVFSLEFNYWESSRMFSWRMAPVWQTQPLSVIRLTCCIWNKTGGLLSPPIALLEKPLNTSIRMNR